jgi:N utilization substance protein A
VPRPSPDPLEFSRPGGGLIAALDQIQEEKGISKESVLALVEGTLAAAFTKALGTYPNLRVRVDPQSGAITVAALLRAVSTVTDPYTEIGLDEARAVQDGVAEGETVARPLDVQDTGRLAAQAGRQAVLQKIREAERDQVLKEVLEHKGEIASGIVERMDGGYVYLDLGKAEGVLAPEEQIPGEAYRLSQRLKVLLLDAKRRSKSPQISVSRAHRNLVKRLLEFEVPELADGNVLVKGLVREAGVRSKIAVAARQEGLDPVGACVGPRGARIRSVVSELGAERVDVVPWSADPSAFVAHALSPAQVIRVDVDRETKTATAHVPAGQLSLAIGKDGQNARLAAKLTGWRIDIKPVPLAAAVSEEAPHRR